MPEQNDVLVSIIVPTYNEEAVIRCTMDSLVALTYHPLEVVVIDDASTDRTVEIIRQYESLIPSLQILPQAVNRGVATSRNVGLKQAKGEIAVILNADVCPEPDFVSRTVAYYADHDADYLIVDAKVLNGDTIYARYVQTRHEHDLATTDLSTLHWTEGFSCKREVALAIGGFPEEFPGASGEDAVFTERLVEAGYKRGMDFDIVVPHIAPATFTEFWKQRLGRGRGGPYRLYVSYHQPFKWGVVLRSFLGTLFLAGIVVPALRYGWQLADFSPNGQRDWIGLAWAHTIDRVAVAFGHLRAAREISRAGLV